MVTGFNRFSKYSFHLPRMSSSLLSKTPFWSLMDISMRYFGAKTPDGLPEHIAGLPAIGIQFVSEILTGFHFGFFTLRLSVARVQGRFSFVL